jgi:hypothetical protein
MPTAAKGVTDAYKSPFIDAGGAYVTDRDPADGSLLTIEGRDFSSLELDYTVGNTVTPGAGQAVHVFVDQATGSADRIGRALHFAKCVAGAVEIVTGPATAPVVTFPTGRVVIVSYDEADVLETRWCGAIGPLTLLLRSCVVDSEVSLP